MQDEKICYITGAESGLHKHHIFFGTANRRKSEKYGCWVWLRSDLHVGSNYAVHNNAALDYFLKCRCQERFEELFGHEKFMETFHKNYLEVDDDV